MSFNISNYEIPNNRSLYDKTLQYSNFRGSKSKTGSTTQKRTDILEISQEAKKLQESDSKMSANSGKDILGISKGQGNNDYKVHFSDSAMVSRAISRGRITVNGVDIELSDQIKNKLREVDKQAENNRMKNYMEYVNKHEAAVAKQQAETWKKAFETPDSLKILLGIDDKMQRKVEAGQDTITGVSWNDFEWKTYETVLDVNLDRGIATLGEISSNEVILNEKEYL
ncbi:hypothetical protein [Lachnospira pectinoschiza]|uniref:Uncharacterized protein n=1 Tax=Lachnospira pectinoschiza TaxID=28052 RepID=A0A1G9UJR3_9FIRM|nr:hypothetical protein [Lachnospira pectinoschiza]SDM60117.1 hypothetical protein SAMN05216544_0790 [Lachnospira pectinoschiza]